MQTGRLILRRFNNTDVDHLYALDNDPEVMRWLNGGEPVAREVVERAILPEFMRESAGDDLLGYWAAIEKGSGEFAGWFSLKRHDDRPPDEVSLGYRFRKEMWGHGYATEGARFLLARAFARGDIQRIVASTYEHNRASRRVMEKLGMTYVCSFRLTPDDLAHATFHTESQEVWDGDEVEYAVTRSDWRRLMGDERGA